MASNVAAHMRLTRPAQMIGGVPARLIPVSKVAEERATSAFLASLTAVREFAAQMFGLLGIPIGKRYDIECYTEVRFKDAKLAAGNRPDGIIILNTGRIIRSFLVETKINREELNEEQVLRYVELARALGLDGVITVSNQHAAVPTHHPVAVPKSKLGKVQLYHWSWGAIVTEAQILAENKDVGDPDQAYILQELRRFLLDSKDIVKPFDSMSPGWDAFCEKVLLNQRLAKNDADACDVISNWHELVRAASLALSALTNRKVCTVLRRGELGSPLTRFQNDLDRLVQDHRLTATFDVPDAAGKIDVTVDARNRTLRAAMAVKAPQDVARAATSVRWIAKQLKDVPGATIVEAHWPGRTVDTMASLDQIREDENVLVPGGTKDLPVEFLVMNHHDLGRGFRARKKFVETFIEFVPAFYRDIGQHVTAWTPRPPRAAESQVDLQSPEEEQQPPIVKLLEPAAQQNEVH